MRSPYLNDSRDIALIYEERRTFVEKSRRDEFIRTARDRLSEAGQASNGQVLCLLSGMIGDPSNDFLRITRYDDLNSWESAQGSSELGVGSLVSGEEVRLLKPISSRPRDVIPSEDRRAIYGYRRIFISPEDLDEFVHCSEEGIWPRIESQGARVLGLWTTVAASDPTEIVLMTGYHSPGHWDETRYDGYRPDHVDEELWDKEAPLRKRREEMAIRSWVRLMRAHEF